MFYNNNCVYGYFLPLVRLSNSILGKKDKSQKSSELEVKNFMFKRLSIRSLK